MHRLQLSGSPKVCRQLLSFDSTDPTYEIRAQLWRVLNPGDQLHQSPEPLATANNLEG